MLSARSGFKPAEPSPALHRPGGEIPDDLLDVDRVERVPVQEMQRMVGATEVHLGQVADGAPHPDQVATLLDDGDLRLVERGLHRLPEILQLPLLGGIGDQVLVADTEGAEREGPGSVEAPVPEARQLHAPATEVHRDTVVHREVVDRAEETEHRLRVPVDDLQGDADAAGFREQAFAVFRLSDRRRRNRDHALRSDAVRDRTEVAEGLEGSIDRLRPQEFVVPQLAAEAERSAGVLQHVEMLARAQPEHDHPRRVGADVHDGERSLIRLRHVAVVHERMLPHRADSLEGKSVAGPGRASGPATDARRTRSPGVRHDRIDRGCRNPGRATTRG